MGQNISRIERLENNLTRTKITCIKEIPLEIIIIYKDGRKSHVSYEELITVMSVIEDENCNFDILQKFIKSRNEEQTDDFLRKKIRAHSIIFIGPADMSNYYRIYFDNNSTNIISVLQSQKLYDEFISDGSNRSIEWHTRLFRVKNDISEHENVKIRFLSMIKN